MRDHIDASTRLLPTKHDNGSFPSITEHGGYELYYLLEEFREEFPCCPMCATALTRGEKDYEGPVVTAVAINYETKNLYCKACNKKLEPAYDDTED